MGADTSKVGTVAGANAPLTTSIADVISALNAALGIPGGLIDAGGAQLFPNYLNLGTPVDQSLHQILGLIAPGGGGQTIQTDEWLDELAAPVAAGTKIILADWAGVNGTTGTPPLDLWETDNNITFFAAGELVARGGSTAVLSATYTATPDGVTFNRDLGIGDQLICQRTIFV